MAFRSVFQRVHRATAAALASNGAAARTPTARSLATAPPTPNSTAHLVAGAGAGSLALAAAWFASSGLVECDESAIAPEACKNRAFVFVKPHAVGEKTTALVVEALAKQSAPITAKGSIPAAKIDSDKLIDNHYGAIASKAMVTKPADLVLSDKAKKDFAKAFGADWASTVKSGKVYNANDACKKLGIDGNALDAKWSGLKRGQNLIKFGGGFYCGQVGDIFVINGFYMSMRQKYCEKGARIDYFLIEWDPKAFAFEEFREKILGATDPATAAPGSVRRKVFDDWKALGLKFEPNVGDNGVHASASPFEAMAERINWVGATVETDPFGSALLELGVPKSVIVSWTADPTVVVDGKPGSLFDALEDMDSEPCLRKAKAIYLQNK